MGLDDRTVGQSHNEDNMELADKARDNHREILEYIEKNALQKVTEYALDGCNVPHVYQLSQSEGANKLSSANTIRFSLGLTSTL